MPVRVTKETPRGGGLGLTPALLVVIHKHEPPWLNGDVVRHVFTRYCVQTPQYHHLWNDLGQVTQD